MKVKVVNLDGIKRVISGELINQIDIDYTQTLSEIRSDIEYIIGPIMEIYQSKLMNRLIPSKKIKNLVRVHEGSSHLDIVDDGIGSLGLLTIQDHKI